MNNGDGLRVVLWLSGCNHKCKGCQNPQTWDKDSGILFDKNAKEELFRELDRDYISGLTLSGGDPLYANNLDDVLNLVRDIRKLFPSKSIWLYSGYDFETSCFLGNTEEEYIQWHKREKIIAYCDVMVDGMYIDELRDISLKWRGSKNQRVINIRESLERGEVVLWTN